MRYDFSIENTFTKTDLIIAHSWTEGRLDKTYFFYKNIEIKPLNMDGNGNQWQQNNGQRIEAIKQQIATMRQNLARNGENLRLVLNVT